MTDRTPYCHKIRYGITGAPILTEDEMDGTFAPGVGIAPALIELVYSTAQTSEPTVPASVGASVTGWWTRFGVREQPERQVTTHFKDGPGGWPAWLAEEARLHDPDAAVPSAPADRTAILREAADWFDRYDVDSARELRRMAGEAQQPETQARRDDAFEAWLKAQRDEHPRSSHAWFMVDCVLDRYRLHADTGTPLGEHVCEGRVAGDCECLEQPAVGAQQPAQEPAIHTGGNVEDCPGCSGSNPPYPFICPGTGAVVAQRPEAREWCKCPSCWGWFVEEHPGEDLDQLGKDLGWWSGLPEHRDAPSAVEAQQPKDA